MLQTVIGLKHDATCRSYNKHNHENNKNYTQTFHILLFQLPLLLQHYEFKIQTLQLEYCFAAFVNRYARIFQRN